MKNKSFIDAQVYPGSQLELGFSSRRGPETKSTAAGRPRRASWWFDRMRQFVDRAVDWEPAPRYVEIAMGNTVRLVVAELPGIVVAPRHEEQEVVE